MLKTDSPSEIDMQDPTNLNRLAYFVAVVDAGVLFRVSLIHFSVSWRSTYAG